MNIAQKLAFATAGVAILAAMKPAPAEASNFELNGTFSDSYLDSFDGNFSSDQSLSALSSNGLGSYQVNIRDGNAVYYSFNNSNSRAIAGESAGSRYLSFSTIPGRDETPDLAETFRLTFQPGSTNSSQVPLQVLFSTNNLETDELLDFSGVGYVVGDRSEPVPEPLTIGGSVLAGGIAWLMKKKIASSQKA